MKDPDAKAPGIRANDVTADGVPASDGIGRLLIQQMSRGRPRARRRPVHRVLHRTRHAHAPVGETVVIEDAGFEVTGVQAVREHYVRTIRVWLRNFGEDLPAVRQILTPEQVRVWRLYLAGGALAFEEGRMGVDQILAARKAR